MALLRLDTVASQPLTWLWYPRFPAGRLSLLVGHPDRGKSIFALTCAAHVSRGRQWPDAASCVAGPVIVLEAEDSLEETVVPRLDAAGADRQRIFSWPERDLRYLREQCHAIHPLLVVLSPLNTYLPATLNTWHDRSVRAALQPLADLAAETKTAILGVMHPPKHQHALPIHTIVGSIAFGAVARSVLVAERTQDHLYLVESIKQNLVETTPPIGYRIMPSVADPTIPVLQWVPVPATFSLIPGDEDSSALADACEYLRMALHSEAVSSTKIRFGAEKQGIAWRTIGRARKLLNVQAKKVYWKDKSHWELSLPYEKRPP